MLSQPSIAGRKSYKCSLLNDCHTSPTKTQQKTEGGYEIKNRAGFITYLYNLPSQPSKDCSTSTNMFRRRDEASHSLTLRDTVICCRVLRKMKVNVYVAQLSENTCRF